MNKSYKVEAVVLKRRNFGEADKLITLFTKQYGKQSTLAKGIRRINSRRSPFLEIFTQAQLVLHRGKTFNYVTEVTPVNSFPLIRQKLERLGFIYIALELVDRLTVENQESKHLYIELVSMLTKLNDFHTTRRQAQKEMILFKQFLLTHLGFIQPGLKPDEQYLNTKIENIIESPLKSPKLLTNIQNQI